MKPVIIIFLIISTLFSCGDIEYEDFSIEQHNYTGNEIRTDGFYWSFCNNLDEIDFSFCVFYRNGILVKAASSSSEGEDIIERVEGASLQGDINHMWGVYEIYDSLIHVEMLWQDGQMGDYVVTTTYFSIINDTTIKLEYFEYLDVVDTVFQNPIYYFKQYSPKPDSTLYPF